MASVQDYYQTEIYTGGWLSPGRSLFPPFSTPSSDFMWLESSLMDMDEQADQMKQAVAAASYSRSDGSSDDDHQHSPSVDQQLHVMSSNYAQNFQRGQNPQVSNISNSDWSDTSLLHDSPNMPIFGPFVNDQKNTNSNLGFYYEDQFDKASKDYSQLGMESNNAISHEYPSLIQNLATGVEDTDMSFVFDNSSALNNWPKFFLAPSPKQQLNDGTKHKNTNNSMPFWDSWMGNYEFDKLESHQLVASSALIKDQKNCNYGNPTSGISLMSSKVGSKDTPANKVASFGSTLVGTKRKNKKTSTGELYKRPRFETPSSLPTFKVRKEKLGDRITALQQLVSPFGKTDTASVLHEAVEYIKFLHDQVNVLGTAYMQNETSTNQGETKNDAGSKSPKLDLKSRGLCLVPISNTFPVASETTADFWTPTFGGTMIFR